MAMYSAYFDESGTPDTGQFLVVAGGVSDVVQWSQLEREWTETLKKFSVPYFHSAAFEQKIPPFDALTDQLADELFYRLIGIICRRVERTVSQAIRLADYRIINEKYVFAECYGFPYPLLGRSCMGIVDVWARRYPDRKLLHFFENGAKHKGQLEWIAERDHLQVPTFLEKTQYSQLQSADLIAWCHNLYLTTSGKVRDRYERGLDRLSECSNQWGLINLTDPDKIPTILNIPVRNQAMLYKSVIIRQHGKRRAVTHYWPKGNVVRPKINRRTLVLPDIPALTLERVADAKARYEGQYLSPEDVRKMAADYADKKGVRGGQ